MESSKSIPFDKKHMIIDKDTFDIMNNVIKESKKNKRIRTQNKTSF